LPRYNGNTNKKTKKIRRAASMATDRDAFEEWERYAMALLRADQAAPGTGPLYRTETPQKGR
jgi:hypothetical protein